MLAPEELPDSASTTPLLVVRGLCKRFSGGLLQRSADQRTVLEEISFTLPAGRTLGVVGASGAGKSTLGRCVALLEECSQGEVSLAGTVLTAMSARQRRPFRRWIQMVFQSPAGSFSPRLTASEVVEEPLLIVGGSSVGARRRRVAELMSEVGLGAELGDRTARALSGGQQARLAIARALAAGPRVLVLDEPFSGLDLSLQAQVANLLVELQTAHQLAYILISHDLRMVCHLADELAVLADGRFVERGEPWAILAQPQHRHTEELAAAAGIREELA
jgi:ABC-type glutathione transport system ATPase component